MPQALQRLTVPPVCRVMRHISGIRVPEMRAWRALEAITVAMATFDVAATHSSVWLHVARLDVV